MSDGVSRDRAKVIAAAQAAASWARARRAVWTNEPLPIVEPPAAVPRDQSPRRERASIQDPVAPSQARVAVPPPRIADYPAEPPVDPVSASVRAAPPPRVAPQPTLRRAEPLVPPPQEASRARWVVPVAAVALFAALGTGAVYKRWVAAPASGVAVPQPANTNRATPAETTGSLRVTSNPTGAEVIVDGRSYGHTPLTIRDLAAGTHGVDVRSGEGSIRRSVTIAAGKMTTLDEAIFAGWVAIYSPFDVSVAEGRRSLPLNDSNQIMLPPGPHDLRLMNRTLEYESVHHVEVNPGETATVSIAAPQSSLTVTASDTAEVWVDGARVGETPVWSLPVAIGVHDIALRRAGAPERRLSVTVTTRRSSVNVDFNRPGH